MIRRVECLRWRSRLSCPALAVGVAVAVVVVTAALAAPSAIRIVNSASAAEVPAGDLWSRIAGGGYLLLIRHASTEPGFGDPPQFRIGDCSTQRNLSPQGRDESRRLGEAFRRHRVPVSEVRSSPWCRCQETAELAFGKAQVWNELASLHFDASREAEQQRAVVDAALAHARRPAGEGNLILVTHNFNIRSLLGVSPSQAEVIVARVDDGRLVLVGRIPPP